MIVVRWIGLNVNLNAKLNKEKYHLKPREFESGKLGTYEFEHFGLTVGGKPICVEEKCLNLANQPYTHVILLQDYDS